MGGNIGQFGLERILKLRKRAVGVVRMAGQDDYLFDGFSHADKK